MSGVVTGSQAPGLPLGQYADAVVAQPVVECAGLEQFIVLRDGDGECGFLAAPVHPIGPIHRSRRDVLVFGDLCDGYADCQRCQ